jgi:DNA polymerase III epsilon subunit-like protein
MEIVFYDIETTIPPTDIIEFGAIVLDKTGLYEKESYSTLIYSNNISKRSIDCNGITNVMLQGAPSFSDISDNIYNILHGRTWAGHNIIRFDNVHIKKAFEKINTPKPEPVGIIDTLPLLRNTFGKRAGNMALASLGHYFGLGQERHRAIEDSRMNLEVLKKCCMIMFLEENANYASDLVPEEKEEILNDTKNIVKTIDEAIKNKQDIWISYNGGSNALVPRQIKPTKWIHYPWKLEAYCHQAQINKNFTQSKICEIRADKWKFSRADLEE